MAIEFDVETVRNRDQAIKAINFLINRHSIKQEELYPWIACSDRMPKEGQEVLVGWLVVGKIRTHEELVELSDVDYGEDPHTFTLQEWTTRDGELLREDYEAPPTHWHPIPTL